MMSHCARSMTTAQYSNSAIYPPLEIVVNLPSETNDRHTNYVVGDWCYVCIVCWTKVLAKFWANFNDVEGGDGGDGGLRFQRYFVAKNYVFKQFITGAASVRCVNCSMGYFDLETRYCASGQGNFVYLFSTLPNRHHGNGMNHHKIFLNNYYGNKNKNFAPDIGLYPK